MPLSTEQIEKKIEKNRELIQYYLQKNMSSKERALIIKAIAKNNEYLLKLLD
jgi:hypothetical protein